MQEIVDALAGEHAALRDRLAGLSPADWARPSQRRHRGAGRRHAFCLLAARRVGPAESGLKAVGPDADDVLELVRTFA